MNLGCSIALSPSDFSDIFGGYRCAARLSVLACQNGADLE